MNDGYTQTLKPHLDKNNDPSKEYSELICVAINAVSEYSQVESWNPCTIPMQPQFISRFIMAGTMRKSCSDHMARIAVCSSAAWIVQRVLSEYMEPMSRLVHERTIFSP